MKLLLVSFLVLLAVSPTFANEPTIDIDSVQEALAALSPSETVPVPVAVMRNALWYYENYWVEKELRVSTEASRDEWSQRATERLDLLEEITASRNTWRSIGLGAGAGLLVSTVTIFIFGGRQ